MEEYFPEVYAVRGEWVISGEVRDGDMAWDGKWVWGEGLWHVEGGDIYFGCVSACGLVRFMDGETVF